MSDRVAELLLKGLRQLPQPEQDEVVAGLLTGLVPPASPAPLQPATPLVQPSGGVQAELVQRLTGGHRLGALAAESGDLKVLPVRLPSEDYERLREWSRAHGFSMAVIIRTLVERFMHDQQRRAAQQKPADGQPPTP